MDLGLEERGLLGDGFDDQLAATMDEKAAVGCGDDLAAPNLFEGY